MRTNTLLRRNLVHFWRTNLAVILGVAAGVSVLAGALLVGDSVRGSLRDLFLNRLGNTDEVVTSSGFFRERLADDLLNNTRLNSQIRGVAPLIVINGFVTHDKSGRRASHVQVYGVNERFWEFHGTDQSVQSLAGNEALPSPDLARELGCQPGDTLLLRVEKPSAIPAGSLHGRKEDLGRSIRVTSRAALTTPLAEFSLRPQQGPVRALFVEISRLQRDLERAGMVNAILLSKNPTRSEDPGSFGEALRETVQLEDLGIKLRLLDRDRGIALESDTAMIGESALKAAATATARTRGTVEPIFSYLANSIRANQREVPYSLVTSVDQPAFTAMRASQANSDAKNRPNDDGATPNSKPPLPPILLSDWAASDLNAKPGDIVELEYYLWREEGRIDTQTAQFILENILPLNAETADQDLVPAYPGITETENIADWDPPFPVDLQRVRPRDEEYWEQYKTTPKAFLQLEVAQRLWGSRHGNITSLRLGVPTGQAPEAYLELLKSELKKEIDPFEAGLGVYPVRNEGLEASQGATDFGQYFVYFSFFLVAAALLLAALFFKLGIEQRLREIGLLRATGFDAAAIRGIFLREGFLLALIGSVLGVVGAIAYGALMMQGLRSWWVGAVGTTALTLHVSPVSLLIGAVGGVAAAVACILWTLKGVAQISPRSLLSGGMSNLKSEMSAGTGSAQGSPAGKPGKPSSRALVIAVILIVIGALLLITATTGSLSQTAGFFGAGTLFLAALLFFHYHWLRSRIKHPITGAGFWPTMRLGFRNATHRPGRSVLCVALIASAAFIIVAVDAFRRDPGAHANATDLNYPLLAESLLPLYHDPNTEEGREELNLGSRTGFDADSVRFTRFRVKPGDDASCLNLYQPRNPRILAPEESFVDKGGFDFQSSLADSDAEKQNPWLLLNSEQMDGAIPVIADANSLQYVLHRKLGDEIAVSRPDGEPLKMRVVAALSDSIFQGELLMSETNFLRLFPEYGGYNFFLMGPKSTSSLSRDQQASITAAVEEQLSDFGFDAMSTGDRLASFHQVENTYLTTFQTLGGLGLLLGTIGLTAVLLRNVLERRRELALLRAVGYNRAHLRWMVISENAFLVLCGLIIGAICALLAISPAFASRGGSLPALSLLLLLLVFITGLIASVAATLAALKTPLIPALRSE